MGKRIDTVIIYKNIIFLLEFKCGAHLHYSTAYDQVYDYALDLHNFHKESHDKLMVPIAISTSAPVVENKFVNDDHIITPLY